MIEVVIAMVLLAIITGATYGVIGLAVRAWRSGSVEFQWIQEGQRALRLMREDLEQVVTKDRIPNTLPQSRRGEMLKVLGGRGQLEFFMIDKMVPVGASALAEVRYRMQDKSLVRLWFSQYAPTPEQMASHEVLLDDVVAWEVGFLSGQGQWVGEWTEAKQAPRAVQLRIEREALRPGSGADGASNVQRQVLTMMVPLS